MAEPSCVGENKTKGTCACVDGTCVLVWVFTKDRFPFLAVRGSFLPGLHPQAAAVALKGALRAVGCAESLLNFFPFQSPQALGG